MKASKNMTSSIYLMHFSPTITFAIEISLFHNILQWYFNLNLLTRWILETTSSENFLSIKRINLPLPSYLPSSLSLPLSPSTYTPIIYTIYIVYIHLLNIFMLFVYPPTFAFLLICYILTKANLYNFISVQIAQ